MLAKEAKRSPGHVIVPNISKRNHSLRPLKNAISNANTSSFDHAERMLALRSPEKPWCRIAKHSCCCWAVWLVAASLVSPMFVAHCSSGISRAQPLLGRFWTGALYGGLSSQL
ncbi:hypothetical protein P154DRAFT_222331 [Amniculicola lignicola CBS 123094]|uniref:Uncharacterized protein n=1 Tax=Amniculicola lignicola CBS 123094 TaxID=1392246 RepID=A0A6A5X0G8_9PLEO|nr:hypothetical protein P154DRAFT_222331 [Amniculicola lignicola CBS 123094]